MLKNESGQEGATTSEPRGVIGAYCPGLYVPPQLIKQAGQRLPGVKIALLPPLGEVTSIVDATAEWLAGKVRE